MIEYPTFRYLSVYKTGSTWTSNLFSALYGKQETEDRHARSPYTPKLTIANVRDPLSWMTSIWRVRTSDGLLPGIWKSPQPALAKCGHDNYEQFIKNLIDNPGIVLDNYLWWMRTNLFSPNLRLLRTEYVYGEIQSLIAQEPCLHNYTEPDKFRRLVCAPRENATPGDPPDLSPDLEKSFILSQADYYDTFYSAQSRSPILQPFYHDQKRTPTEPLKTEL